MDGGREEGNQQTDRSFWTSGIKEGFISDLVFNLSFTKGARVRSQSTC